ncbi:hypothetical protein [Cytobacillus sp. IB215316]|uniref:hypothetical protein n=1 Tax=Cytobacillus sp. IB215316 TaxID=3097354 RepID=UPI002A15A40E|nr:hypothetical protein [Cytobacillus sp. IB215316]MDX8363023.1 hypothetical protein [Cytobacillus sp. IB215316]
MGFFSKLFGKGSPKQQETERHSYNEILEFIIIYKGNTDSDEQADKYIDLENELWMYDCIGQSGAMSSKTAKEYGMPLPTYPEYPLIGVFDLSESKGYPEIFTKPLIISSKKEEIKRFLEEFERAD